jgi:hypothetical protein
VGGGAAARSRRAKAIFLVFSLALVAPTCMAESPPSALPSLVRSPSEAPDAGTLSSAVLIPARLLGRSVATDLAKEHPMRRGRGAGYASFVLRLAFLLLLVLMALRWAELTP